eukprot:303294-Pyramimonas_sp.AAC.1
MPPEAFFFGSEHSHALKELYEVPGGDRVDGSPPVPVPRRAPTVVELEEFGDTVELVGEIPSGTRSYLPRAGSADSEVLTICLG